MKGILVTNGPGRLPASHTQGANQQPVANAVKAEDVHATSGASLFAVEGSRDADRLDAVAGSEFVDDRIRLRE